MTDCIWSHLCHSQVVLKIENDEELSDVLQYISKHSIRLNSFPGIIRSEHTYPKYLYADMPYEGSAFTASILHAVKDSYTVMDVTEAELFEEG